MIFVAQNPRPAIAASGNVLGPLHPCQAVGFMRERGLAGNVYVPLPWGSYVTWHLYPAVRVSMDGRNISLFPRDMVRESLEYLHVEPPRPRDAAPLRYGLSPRAVELLEAGRARGRHTMDRDPS